MRSRIADTLGQNPVCSFEWRVFSMCLPPSFLKSCTSKAPRRRFFNWLSIMVGPSPEDSTLSLLTAWSCSVEMGLTMTLTRGNCSLMAPRTVDANVLYLFSSCLVEVLCWWQLMLARCQLYLFLPVLNRNHHFAFADLAELLKPNEGLLHLGLVFHVGSFKHLLV